MPAKPKSPRLVHLDTPDDAIPAPVTKAPAAPKNSRPSPADEQRRQAAFDSVFHWAGEELHPFSVSREALFGQLRCAMGAPSLSRCMADTEAFAADAHRILYLCATPPEIFNRLRADMADLQTAVDAWAEQNIPAAEKLRAETLAMQIWLAAHENRHEPAPVATPHGDDEGN